MVDMSRNFRIYNLYYSWGKDRQIFRNDKIFGKKSTFSMLLNVENVHFVRQITILEHLFRLIKQHRFILVSRAVMAQQ